MARGPGLRQGVRLPMLSILDVAPLLLHSLDIDIPRDMEGTVPAAAYQPGWLQSRSVRQETRRTPQTAPVHIDDATVFTKEDERILAQHLRKLGYIE